MINAALDNQQPNLTPTTTETNLPRFNFRRLVFCVAASGFGIILSRYTHGAFPTAAVCIFALFSGITLFFNKKAFLFFFCAFLGAVRLLIALPSPNIQNSTVFTATVRNYDERNGSYVLQNVSSDENRYTGRILLEASTISEAFDSGDIVMFIGSYRPISLHTADSSELYLLSNGVVGYAENIIEFEQIAAIKTPFSVLYGVRESCLLLCDTLFDEYSPLARALLFNDTSKISREISASFRASGVSHILSLSGLHVSVLVALLLVALPKRTLRLRLVFVSLFLVVYCALALSPPSLLRSCFMCVFLLLSALSSRRYDAITALAASLMLILIINPLYLFSVGLQLSFAATSGIVLLYQPIQKRMLGAPQALAASLSVSISATAGVVPISAYHFRTISTYSLFANLLIVPISSVALPLCLAPILLYSLAPNVFENVIVHFAIPAKAALASMTFLSGAFSSLPYNTLSLAEFPAVACVFLYAAILVLSPLFLREKHTKYLYAFVFIICASLCLLVWGF